MDPSGLSCDAAYLNNNNNYRGFKKLEEIVLSLDLKRADQNDGDSNERRWPAGNQPIDTPSVDKRQDEERGDRNRRARKGR